MLVAVIAALIAGFLAVQLSQPAVVTTAPVIEREPVVDILAAASDLAVGDRLIERSFQWVKWPKANVPDGFIRKEDRPNATQELAGSIARLPIFAGEAIRQEKIADPSSGVLSALLPAGKRALSVDISASSGAGGLILPNDRVDVITVRDTNGAQLSEVVLSNIRVLAVDQATATGKKDEKPTMGTTATLELTEDQARILTTAKASSQQLTLGLRSIADAGESDTTAPAHLLGTKANASLVQVIKSGAIQSDDGQSPAADLGSAVANLAATLPRVR
nr:Flp pilus assembly protein CpaB [Rhizobium sp. CFBP 8762]